METTLTHETEQSTASAGGPAPAERPAPAGQPGPAERPVRQGGTRFWKIYGIFVLVLAVLALAASLYVRGVLREYEASQPVYLVEAARAQLADEAQAGTLWSQYGLPDPTPGRFEDGQDIRAAYTALLCDENTVCVKQTARREDDHICYDIKAGSLVLAEVELRPDGAPKTLLTILTQQSWALEEVRPVLRAHDYTLQVPDSFSVRVGGAEPAQSDGTPDGAGNVDYVFSGVYLQPEVEVLSPSGAQANVTFRGDKIVPEIYRYDMTLPASLSVTVNGAPHAGTDAGDRRVRHDIIELEKPTVEVADRFGNSVEFDGKNAPAMTAMTVRADSRYTVAAAGQTLTPDSTGPVPEYETFSDFVEDLPQIATYHIAVLQKDAPLEVLNAQGEALEVKPGLSEYEFMDWNMGADTVPQEIADEIDVLGVAQTWSLFLTTDKTFSQLSPYLLRGSYQYEVAYKYAHGIDITFTSIHTLLNPAFTDEAVGNFVRITDSCFSVDIQFVKHMHLDSGMYVDDAMHDRFYFVYYDDTDDGRDNPAWKLAGIKEIL